MSITHTTLRIASRKSPLALWQANYVKNTILAIDPTLEIEILGFLTEGDKKLDSSLAKIGGKGLFVKELETALLQKKADIAVHSVKDMPVQQTSGLTLIALYEREDPRDAFISSRFADLDAMPPGTIVGTSSARRACLLRGLRPDLKIEPLRGNVGTRLQKLDEGHYDAIILAAAGLKRLGESARIRQYLDTNVFIPSVGQGAIGIECRADNHRIFPWILPLDHPTTRLCITAERAFNTALGGGCQLPIAAHAICVENHLKISGFVAHPDKNESVKGTLSGAKENAESLGKELAHLLLQKGAEGILEAIGGRGLGRYE